MGVADETIDALRALELRGRTIEEAASRRASDLAEVDALPSIASLCLARPLYDPLETRNRVYLERLRGEQVQFDAFCIGCGSPSIFKDRMSRGSGAGSSRPDDWMEADGQFELALFCQRADHRYVFSFDYRDGRLTKFGQLPSLEDIAGHDIRKYAPLLRDGYFGELKRATGLASHGIGIGSFVYLRRIFERLIDDHHASLEADGRGVAGFSSMRMEERIGALRDVLPPALVRHRATYAILSSGIHALDEETCRRYFPVVRAAIIEILEQDLRAREQAKAAAELDASISRLVEEAKRGRGSAA